MGSTRVRTGAIPSQSIDGIDYDYEVTGESFQRNHLTAVIRAHTAFESGEICSTAVL